jgi:hypothetical protein
MDKKDTEVEYILDGAHNLFDKPWIKRGEIWLNNIRFQDEKVPQDQKNVLNSAYFRNPSSLHGRVDIKNKTAILKDKNFPFIKTLFGLQF